MMPTLTPGQAEFARIWNASDSAQEAADALGTTRGAAATKASALRKRGVELKTMPGSNGSPQALNRSKWGAVDWSMENSAIAAELGVSRESVRRQRVRRFGTSHPGRRGSLSYSEAIERVDAFARRSIRALPSRQRSAIIEQSSAEPSQVYRWLRGGPGLSAERIDELMKLAGLGIPVEALIDRRFQ